MEGKVKPKFQDLISNPETPVLVDFYADWCGPCQTMAPVIKEIADTFSGKIKVIKIDVDKNQQIASHYKIMGVPTFILFRNGEIVWRQSGMTTSSMMKKAIEKFV